MRVPVARESMKSKEAFLLELGSIVTLARLLGPTGRARKWPKTIGNRRFPWFFKAFSRIFMAF